jgi:hypothetical protein
MNEIDEFNVDWDEKKNMCIWRGNVVNGSHRNFFNPENKLDINPREYFVKLYKKNNFIDMNYENINTSIADQIEYKYILDIDGWSNTWDGTIWKLYSGSVLLKVKSNWQQWYYDELKEWIHYIPIENDFSDLNDKIKWCKNNDDKCKKIVENARKFVNEKLNLKYVNNKIIKKVKKYLQLTNQ